MTRHHGEHDNHHSAQEAPSYDTHDTHDTDDDITMGKGQFDINVTAADLTAAMANELTADAHAALSEEQVANEMEMSDMAFETPEITRLRERVVVAEAALDGMRDSLLRARAETENVQRRSKEEVEKARKYGIERFAGELLAVKDALELALSTETATTEQLREGVTLTLKQLGAAFDKVKITEINPLGQPFDPNFHQAVQVIQSDAPANTCVQVFQKGYIINERVLRPAMVIVSK
jgi:molecular chaperone GrpE